MENESTSGIPDTPRSRSISEQLPITITVNIVDTVPLSLYKDLEDLNRRIKNNSTLHLNKLAEKEIECQALRTKITQLAYELEIAGKHDLVENILGIEELHKHG